MILKRCDVDPDFDFPYIQDLSEDKVLKLGTATSKISEEILIETRKIIEKSLTNNLENKIESDNHIEYTDLKRKSEVLPTNENINQEKGGEHYGETRTDSIRGTRNTVQGSGRDPLSDNIARERERGQTATIWNNESEISERERSINEGNNGNTWNIDRSPLNNAGRSGENGGTSGKADERESGSKRGVERERLDDIRSDDGEHNQLSERDCQK